LSVAWHRLDTSRSGVGRGRSIDVAYGAPEPGPATGCWHHVRFRGWTACRRLAGRDRGWSGPDGPVPGSRDCGHDAAVPGSAQPRV